MCVRRFAALFVLALVWPAATAVAQPIGTFRWQLQPYCNVLTVNVTQQGAIYTLDGTDDRCGGGSQSGSAVGIAYLTPLGLVGFGITTVLPNGTPIHTEATISISSLNGTWRDSAGNSGTFTFTPGAPTAGAPRPIPSGGVAPASITNVQIAPSAVNTTHIVNGTITNADLAAPTRAAASSANNVALAATAAVVTSVTIAAPAAGLVLAHVSASVAGSPAGTNRRINCALTTGTTLPGTADTLFLDYTVIQTVLGATNAFPVAAPGNITINFVCREFVGDSTLFGVKLNTTYVGQ
jgi:hypothetical protein